VNGCFFSLLIYTQEDCSSLAANCYDIYDTGQIYYFVKL